MKQKHRIFAPPHHRFKRIWLLVLLTIFVGAAFTDAIAQRQSLEIAVSLANTAVMTGEPAVIGISAKNPINAKFNPYFAYGKMDWLRIIISDAQGHSLPAIPQYIPPEPADNFAPVSRPLEAGGVHAEDIVLNQKWLLSESGKYNIRVQFIVPCYEKTASGFDIVDGKVKPVSVYRAEKTLTLTLTKPNNAQLGKIADGFLQTMRQKENWAAQNLARKELFSMPEAAALPVWKRLIETADNNGLTVEELARLRTPASVELLAAIAENPKWTQELRGVAKGHLWNMYMSRKQFANRALEAALTKILLRLDGELPRER